MGRCLMANPARPPFTFNIATATTTEYVIFCRGRYNAILVESGLAVETKELTPIFQWHKNRWVGTLGGLEMMLRSSR